MNGKELVDKLRELWARRKHREKQYLEAKQELDKEVESRTKAALDEMDAEAVAIIDAVFPECNLSNQRAAICMEAAADGLTPADIKRLIEARYVGRKNGPVYLPVGKYKTLSRGRGWCRLGRGANAKWAKEANWKEYEVYEPGTWSVGSTDGYTRKDRSDYKVYHVGSYLCADPA